VKEMSTSTSFHFEELVSNDTINYRGLLMSKLVKVWSGEQFYIQDSRKAFVDFRAKKICLPLSDKWEMVRAFGQHESAHVLFTNTARYTNLTKELRAKYGGDIVWRVINALEDRRIEYLFTKIFPGAKDEFEKKNFKLMKKIYRERKKLSAVDYVLIQIIAYMIHFPVKNIDTNEKLKELIEFVNNEITKKWTQVSVVNATKRVLEYLRDIKKGGEKREGERKESRIGGIGSEEGDRDQDEISEKLEVGVLFDSDEIQKSKFKSRALSQRSIERLIQERKNNFANGKREKEKKDPFKKVSDSSTFSYIPIRKMITEEEIARKLSYSDEFLYEQVVTENAGLISRLRKAITQIRNTFQMREDKGGSININRSIQSYMQARMPTFDKVSKDVGRSISLTFLLDQSGSMNSPNKIGRAKKALVILSEALKTIEGIEFSIFGFCSIDRTVAGMNYHTMNTYRYKGFSEKRTDLIASAKTGIGNRDGYHIRVVRSYILQHANPKAQRFLIVLSDGDPADNSTEYMHSIAARDTMKAINETQMHFPVIGVLFGEPTPIQKYLYRNKVQCSHERLDESLQQLVLNIQRQVVS